MTDATPMQPPHPDADLTAQLQAARAEVAEMKARNSELADEIIDWMLVSDGVKHDWRCDPENETTYSCLRCRLDAAEARATQAEQREARALAAHDVLYGAHCQEIENEPQLGPCGVCVKCLRAAKEQAEQERDTAERGVADLMSACDRLEQALADCQRERDTRVRELEAYNAQIKDDERAGIVWRDGVIEALQGEKDALAAEHRAQKAALEHIVRVLDPAMPESCAQRCEGCAYTWQQALEVARQTLAGGDPLATRPPEAPVERTPLKLDVSREWCIAAAEAEAGHDVSAGSPPEAPEAGCSCVPGTVCIRCPIHNPSGTWED